jgi:DUF2934 family protein
MMKDPFVSTSAGPFFKGPDGARRTRGLLMAKTPSSNVVRKAGSKAKSTKTSAQPGSAGHSPAIEGARLDEDRIRERAYGIWIAEGRPHGRELAHWQRAHHELQHEAR